MILRFCLLLSLLPLALDAQMTDSARLDQMLRELRELRQDIQGLTMVAQRVQILLYRVQLQDYAVKRSLTRYESAKSKLTEAESNRARADAGLKEYAGKAAAPENPGDREMAEGMIREIRGQMEHLSREEGQARAAEADAARELRTEEGKLNELVTRLDRIELQLEALPGGRPAK